MIYRIKPTNELRTSLFIEDLYKEELDTLAGFGLVNTIMLPLGDGKNFEAFLELKTPIPVPNFSKFYGSKITSSTDKYLPDLIQRLLYLNPAPSRLLLKNITQHIIVNYGVYTTIESAVTNRSVDLPLLKFEDIYPVVCGIANSDAMKDYTPDATRVTLFRKHSNISSTTRRELSKQARLNGIRKNVEEVIHQSAEYLNEADMLLKITNSRITSYNTQLTLHKTKTYMSEKTIRYIKEANLSKYFSTQRSVNMFYLYQQTVLEIPDVTSRELVEKLSLSHSTITEFKKINSKLV